ncbi:MAG: ABC transporter permease [Blastocatellia bacterium]
METLLQDLRYAVRMLRTRPGFTAAAVISLALGIGACAAIFSVVDSVLLRSLPYPEAERIVQLREVSEKGTYMPVAEPNFTDARARNNSLEGLAQLSGGLVTVTGGSQPVRTRAYWVSGDFFRVLKVETMAGRVFLPEESTPGGAQVAVVSYGFWQRLMGGNSDLTKAALTVDDQTVTVVGVMPQGFAYPEGAEVWIPRETLPAQTSRTAHNWSVIGRVRSDVAVEQARADLSAIGRQFKQDYGKDVDAVDLAIIPLQEYQARNVRSGLWILFGAVGFLLLIACANVANLLLAQATARRKELAVRSALGATRLRLARQFITESMTLALIAAAIGALLSLWGVDLLVALNKGNLPRASEIGVNGRALIFTLALAMLVAVALGLFPALKSAGKDLQSTLKESERGQSANSVSHRLRGLLVVSQVALTLILLIGAGLLIRSFVQLLRIDPGFRPESAVAMDISPASPKTDQERQQLVRFHRQLLEGLSRLPGVTAVGGVTNLPLTGGGPDGTFLIDNDPANTGYAEYRRASEGYFAAIGIPLLRGRMFEQSDTVDSPHVAVISQSLAEKYWPGEDPLGKRIQFGNMDGDLRLLNVIGIVGDVRDYGLESNVRPAIYAYSFQRPPSSNNSIVVRASVDASALISACRGELESLSRDVPANFRTVEQIFSSSLDERRFSLILFSVFAGVALLLAVTGIYGVMSYVVTQRTHEIGIRMALGAQSSDVLKMVIKQGMKLTAIGVVTGVMASFALTRLIESLLFGVSATDPATFAGVVIMLIVVTLAACYIPARRATKVDPMIALRYE